MSADIPRFAPSGLTISSPHTFQSIVSSVKGAFLRELLRGNRESYGLACLRRNFRSIFPFTPEADRFVQSTPRRRQFFARQSGCTCALR
jgi:hypothetical protein